MAVPIGELGLDVSEFKSAMNESKSYLKQFEQAAKDTNAKILLLKDAILASGKATKTQKQDLAHLKQELGFYNSEIKKTRGEISKFDDALKKSSSNAGKSGKSIVTSISSIRGAFYTLGASAIVGSIISMTKAVLEFGKHVSETARVTGTLPSALMKTQEALSDHLGAEDTTAAIHSINTAMIEAKNQSAEAQNKFKLVGVSLRDLKKSTPDQVLIQLADFYVKAADKAEAFRRISLLVGDDMTAKLIPSLIKGSKALRDLAASADVPADHMTVMAEKGARSLDALGRKASQVGLIIAGMMGTVIESRSLLNPFLNTPAGKLADRKGGKHYTSPGGIANENVGAKAGASGPLEIGGLAAGAKAKQDSDPKLTFTAAKEKENTLLDEQTKQLKEQGRIADARLSDAEKEVQLAQSALDFSEAEYQLKKNQGGIEEHQLDVARKVNAEKLASAKLGRDLVNQQNSINRAEASQGRGFEEKRKVDLIEVAAIEEKISVIRSAHKGLDTAESVSMKKLLRDKLLDMKVDRERHDDSLEALRMQNAEIDAQRSGMLGIIEPLKVEAQYRVQILDALRNQNKEAARLLQHQKDIAMQAAKAKAHDVTAKDRREARKAERDIKRKGRQLDAQDKEQVARADRQGLKEGDKEVTPRMGEALERRRMAKDAVKSASNSGVDAAKSMSDIVKTISDNVIKLANNSGGAVNFSK